MKVHKCVKFRLFMELEDDKHFIIQVHHLVYCLSCSQFVVTKFEWCAGGCPSLALHTDCSDTPFTSFTLFPLDWLCATQFNKRSCAPCLSCIYCTTQEIRYNPTSLGSLPPRTQGKSITYHMHSRTSATASSNAPSASQL